MIFAAGVKYLMYRKLNPTLTHKVHSDSVSWMERILGIKETTLNGKVCQQHVLKCLFD